MQAPKVNIMNKKVSPNHLAEKKSESRNIPDKFFEENYTALEEDLIPLVETETLERVLYGNDEPIYFYKGAVLSLFFCLPFWIILFWLINWLLKISNRNQSCDFLPSLQVRAFQF